MRGQQTVRAQEEVQKEVQEEVQEVNRDNIVQLLFANTYSTKMYHSPLP